jgi:hypothetical protein
MINIRTSQTTVTVAGFTDIRHPFLATAVGKPTSTGDGPSTSIANDHRDAVITNLIPSTFIARP